MVYTEVGWASDGTHPLSQANMKTLDAGVDDVHTSDYRRGGRTLVGYFNRGSDGSTNDATIICNIPVWAQGFRFFEIILTASVSGADSDMGVASVRLNTTTSSGNDSQWVYAERWESSGGDGDGGVFDNVSGGNFGVAARLGRLRGTARLLLERNLSTSGWSLLSDWGAHGSSGVANRGALGNAFSSWSGTVDIDTLFFVAGGIGVDFTASSRVAVYGVARPGLDTDSPGVPDLDI